MRAINIPITAIAMLAGCVVGYFVRDMLRRPSPYSTVIGEATHAQENLSKNIRPVKIQKANQLGEKPGTKPELDLNQIRSSALEIDAEINTTQFELSPSKFEASIKRFAQRIESLPEPYRGDLWSGLAAVFAAQTITEESITDVPSVLAVLNQVNETEMPGAKREMARFMKAVAVQAVETGIHDFTIGGDVKENKDLITELRGTIAGVHLTKDLTVALDGLVALQPPELRRFAEPQVLSLMALHDRRASVAFFLSAESNCPRDKDLIISLFGTGTFEDGQSISALIRDAPKSIRRDWAVLEMIDKLAYSDFKAGLAWVTEIADRSVRAEALDALKNPRSYSAFTSSEQVATVLKLIQAVKRPGQ